MAGLIESARALDYGHEGVGDDAFCLPGAGPPERPRGQWIAREVNGLWELTRTGLAGAIPTFLGSARGSRCAELTVAPGGWAGRVASGFCWPRPGSPSSTTTSAPPMRTWRPKGSIGSCRSSYLATDSSGWDLEGDR
jgi:hypothetical protein